MNSNHLHFLTEDIVPYIHTLVNKSWIPPHIISERIIKKLSSHSDFIELYDEVIVSGETDNISIYFIGQENIIIFTPFICTQNNIVFRQVVPSVLIKHNDNIYVVKKNKEIMDRLSFPKIILINPSVKDVFPAPRLALCVASIAAYLRKYQKADVRIMDMQVGPTLNAIIKKITNNRPDIIGISISFGQIDLAEFILQKIFNLGIESTIVAGNVIASFGQEELFKRFPELIVCTGEGENTMIDMVDYVRGKKQLNDVSGITYIKNGQVLTTSTEEVPMDDIPFPSMDTVEEITKNRGALTMELSRGCFHSACTFCPRTNKCKKWKGMSPNLAIKQLEHYVRIFDEFRVARRIFMADEEFIGWVQDGDETKRIIDISDGLIRKNLEIHFETNTRVDQIYNPKKNREWHIERMKMLHLCKQSGLDRLLIGVESGSDSVLERFNKRIKSKDSIMACRILTSLGIGLRMTFITFDPLMKFSELKENVHFLERKDAFLKIVSSARIDYSDLFSGIHDSKFIQDNSLNQPFYEYVTYMLVNLEVLTNSKYFEFLSEELILDNELDYNMARYKVVYEDKTIGDIAINCQKWIDKHFALDYYLKGLHKVTRSLERKRLFDIRASYRKLSFLLLKSLTWIFDDEDTINIYDNYNDLKDIINNLETIKNRHRILNGKREEIIVSVLNLFNQKMVSLVKDMEEAIGRGEISIGRDGLSRIISQWKENLYQWKLINPI